METPKRHWRITRRGFLIGLGLAGAGVALGVRYGVPEAQRAIAGAIDRGALPPASRAAPTIWFDLSPDALTLYLAKVEMGQGIHTALAQIAAEELELSPQDLRVVQASTARGLRDSGTSGSMSVTTLYTPLREAAATLREMMRSEAAKLMGLPLESLEVADGRIYNAANPSQGLTYLELAAQVTNWQVPRRAPALKPMSSFKHIGQSVERIDLHAKVTGRAVYGYDARLPGMLYGAVARPPRLGASLLAAAAGTATEAPGVVRVVLEDGFAGIVAASRAQAHSALERLELTWEDVPATNQADIEALVTVGNAQPVVIQREGNAPAQLATPTLVAEYRTPFAAHAHLEPQAALVDVQADKVTAYVSTQGADGVRRSLARLLGREPDTVEVTPTYLGGGFGRKISGDAALEAARLSRAIGKPVHVGWTRAEEFQHGFLRPPTHHRFSARLEGERLVALQHQQASGEVAFPFFPSFVPPILGADFGAWRGGMIQYDVAHKRTTAELMKLPVPTGWWRGLGLLANTFALESFIDETAHAAGVDALEFRLRHLPATELGQRFRGVLMAATERAGWGSPAPEGRARGLAISTDVRTVVAQVAEVSVEDGRIRVHRFTSAMDAGLIINPDGANAQVQGAIVMGLSSTLLENITIRDGNVEATNFDRYPLLTLSETPEIESVLVSSGAEPYGVGEPPLGPVAAAVANAVFALTGQRLRTLPLKLEG